MKYLNFDALLNYMPRLLQDVGRYRVLVTECATVVCNICV